MADDDLKALLVMLTRKRTAGGNANVSGYRKLDPFRSYHSPTNVTSFENEIVTKLRSGEVVIIDLSQGDPKLQATYSERICKTIFSDAMQRFIGNEDTNYIQLYFEEAHNLFPKKDDKDLSQIYNRVAKEGAKLRLGLIYATQEVSSISSNVLKNTQNWFVSHLNNIDELREVEKFYDFEDFVESLRRAPDRGFIRMKTYSNAFIVPVQIDRFSAKKVS
jgi:DNA helicase HerA-like ATPase